MLIKIHVVKLRIRILVERDGEEFYAYCPDLKGVHVGGETEEEALRNAREAVEAYIESLMRHQQPIPVGVLESSNCYTPGQLFGMLIRSLLPTRKHAVVEEISVSVPA